MFRALFAALVLFSSVLNAWAAAPDVIAYADRSKADRPRELAVARRVLSQLRRGRLGDQSTRKYTIERAEAYIAGLENPLEPYYAPADFALMNAEIGDVGAFAEETVRVFQVVDSANSIVETFQYRAASPAIAEMWKDGTLRPTDRNIARRRMLWLKGSSTDGMEKDRDVMLDGVFAVTGNTTYETVLGSNTILVLERFDLAPHADKFTRKSDLRTWTSAGGKHTLEAIFMKVERGKVKLMRPDGESTAVPLDKLADADRDYIRELIAAEKKALATAAKKAAGAN